jgi:hypothetical protein
MKLFTPMYFHNMTESLKPVGSIGFFGVFEGAITRQLYVTCSDGLRVLTETEAELFRSSHSELQIVLVSSPQSCKTSSP